MQIADCSPRSVGAKHCRQCAELKDISQYELMISGNHHATCKGCRADRRNAAKKARRAAWKQTPAYEAHLARLEREREARELARYLSIAGQPRRRPNLRCGVRGSSRPQPLSPDQMRANAERVSYLLDLLHDRCSTEQITNQQSWDTAERQLKKLWPQSGPKRCTGCLQDVAPDQMHPPTRSNGRPGLCNPCAKMACEADHRRTYGPLIGPLPGPPKIKMRDGTLITLKEFARRVAANPNSQRHYAAA
jgi:hypothetical protein